MNGLRRMYGSLTGRMVLAAVVLHALLVPVLAIGIHKNIANGIRDEFVNNARSQSRQLALLLEGKSSRAATEATLQDWLLSGQVVFADVLPSTGAIIRGRGPETGKALAFIEDYRFGEHGDDVYYISVPIDSGPDEIIGTLRVGFDESSTKERIELLYSRGLLLVVGYFFVALLLAWGAGRLLRRSIRQISDATRRAATGDASEDLRVETHIAEVSSLGEDLEFLRRELVERGRAMQSMAFHDSLTGLANRIQFRQRLVAAIDVARRSGGQLAVLYLDLDRFKRINDTLGHDAGDHLLRDFAKRLQECLRHGDFVSVAIDDGRQESVARLGGDEFTVLLPELSQARDAEHVAQRILDSMRQPLSAGDQMVYTTASIGIALYPMDGRDPDSLLKNADAAMYHSKQEGRNRFHFYTGSLNPRTSPRLDLESRLHGAIDDDRLVVYYQPQVAIDTGKLVGAEALVRWNHPDRGMVSPGLFIPMAEESGIIISIGEWVLRQACAQLRRWHDDRFPGLRMSVNVSVKQLRQATFVRTVASAMDEFGIAPGKLQLEITHLEPIERDTALAGQIESLRTLGVGLVIDDFGGGSSSLAQITQWPAQTLKIGLSLMQRIPDEPRSCAVVQAIINLGRDLGINVIGQGVETARQREFLARHGCPEMQGYLVSPPIPPETFASLF